MSIGQNSNLVNSPHRPAAGPQLRANRQPNYHPDGFGTLGEHNPPIPVDLDEAETSEEAVEQSKNFLKRAGEAKNKLAGLRGSKKTNLSMGWLARDPSEWIGRKIRHRLNGKVFLVRNTFPNGRVELEKSWMMYLSFVWTIRAEYETYSA